MENIDMRERKKPLVVCIFDLPGILQKKSLGIQHRKFQNPNYSTNFAGRSAELQKYLKRQMNDEFSKLAREHSYRARSAFKLIEMNEKHKIINPGDIVIDVGAGVPSIFRGPNSQRIMRDTSSMVFEKSNFNILAPGSWCQVLGEIIFAEQIPLSLKNKSNQPGYILADFINPKC